MRLKSRVWQNIYGRKRGNHLPLWDKVEIIDRTELWRIRRLKESAHMFGYNDLLSRPSIELNTIWEPIIKKARWEKKSQYEHRYGPDAIYQWKQLEKLNQKMARMTSHLTFLCRCRDLKLVPPGLTIKIPVHSRRARKVTKRLEQELIRDRIHNNRWKKHQLWLEISSKLTLFLEKYQW